MERKKTYQNKADKSWSKWCQNASKCCNGMQQSPPNNAKQNNTREGKKVIMQIVVMSIHH